MIESTIQPKDFLTASAAITALSFAIFVFVFPKAKEITESRFKYVSNIDVPDFVRKDRRFRMEVFIDSIGFYFIGTASLLLGFYFSALLLDIVGYYLRIRPVLDLPIPESFRYGVVALGTLFGVILVVAIAWFTAGGFISKKLPLIVQCYAKITLERRVGPELSSGLLNEAQVLIKNKEYAKAILHAITALECEVRRKLNLGPLDSFTNVMHRLKNARLERAIVEQLENTIRVRNSVAHATVEPTMLKQDAKQIVDFVGEVLKSIPDIDLSPT